MTRFTLKSNLTTTNVRAELHSAPYPLPGSSSILKNKTAHLARYFSKLARIFSGSFSPTKYQFLAT